MAKNRVPEPQNPTESEDVEDETASSEEEEEEEESESEPEPQTQTQQTTKKPTTAPPPPASSSEEEELDGSDSDDSETEEPFPNIKPISTKPMDTTPTKKPKSKSAPSPSTVPASTKRQAPTPSDAPESKKPKKKSETEKEPETEKRQLFQRLWSEEDEIELLQGMIEYSAKNKADPASDLSAFHEFIQKKLHMDVSKSQLQSKLRNLKKKFINNKNKERKGKKERVFSKPHEQKSYELSKKIWGGDKIDNTDAGNAKDGNGKEEINGLGGGTGTEKVELGAKKLNKSTKKEGNNKNDVMVVQGMQKGAENGELHVASGAVPTKALTLFGNVGDWVMSNGIEFVDGAKRVEMEEKWKKFMVEELEVHHKKLGLMREQTKMVLDGLKASLSRD